MLRVNRLTIAGAVALTLLCVAVAAGTETTTIADERSLSVDGVELRLGMSKKEVEDAVGSRFEVLKSNSDNWHFKRKVEADSSFPGRVFFVDGRVATVSREWTQVQGRDQAEASLALIRAIGSLAPSGSFTAELAIQDLPDSPGHSGSKLHIWLEGRHIELGVSIFGVGSSELVSATVSEAIEK